MARGLQKLAPAGIKKLPPGKHCDGGGLWLIVDAEDRRRWTFRFMLNKRAREMGLGPFPTVSLAAARELAEAHRKTVAAKQDPIEVALSAREVPTFGDYTETLLNSVEGNWKNTKHRQQWRNTLKTYAEPLAKMKVDEIGVHHVLKCLEPIWETKRETASRVRGRIEFVLDAAKSKGFRTGENPAAWRGNIKFHLSGSKNRQRKHHAALPFDQVGAFYKALEAREAPSAKALLLLILTATRTQEVIGARWEEFDLDAKVWTIPAARMKAKREHRVPLAPEAMALIEGLLPDAKHKGNQPIGPLFIGRSKAGTLSNMALEMLIRRMNEPDPERLKPEGGEPEPPRWADASGRAITPHGFRSAFRDWVAEATSFPSDLAEQALAHLVGNAVERAYRRGDALDRRRKLMDAWASYASRPAPATGSNVRQLGKVARS
jgi:integrase